MATGSKGHQIDPNGNYPAIAGEALALPQQDIALGVVYNGSATGGIQQVRLPDADGEVPAGVVYGKSYASGDQITMATKGRVWMVAAEALATINTDVMLDDATGYVLAATSAKPKLGTTLSVQSTISGLILIDLQLGSYEPA